MQLMNKKQLKDIETEQNDIRIKKRIEINQQITKEISSLNFTKLEVDNEKRKMLENLAEFSMKVLNKNKELLKEVEAIEERKRIALIPINEELAKLDKAKAIFDGLAQEVNETKDEINELILKKRQVLNDLKILDMTVSKNIERNYKEKKQLEKLIKKNKDLSKDLMEEVKQFESSKKEAEKIIRKGVDRVRYEDEKIQVEKRMLKMREIDLKKQEININSKRSALNTAIAEAKRKGIKL